jgi:hypothetical protein
MLRGEILCAFESARADGHDFGAEQGVGGSHDAARRNSRRSENADAYHGAAVSHDCTRCGTLSRQEREREQE